MGNEAKAERLLPLHAVPSDGSVKVRRLPGRPRKVHRAPDHDQRAYIAAANAARAAWIDRDEVVSAVRGGSSAAEIFWSVKLAVAEEAASLAFDIQKADASADLARTMNRHIDALVKLADIELDGQRVGLVDPVADNRAVQRVVALLVESIRGVAFEVLPATDAGRLMEMFMGRCLEDLSQLQTVAVGNAHGSPAARCGTSPLPEGARGARASHGSSS